MDWARRSCGRMTEIRSARRFCWEGAAGERGAGTPAGLALPAGDGCPARAPNSGLVIQRSGAVIFQERLLWISATWRRRLAASVALAATRMFRVSVSAA